MKRRKEGEGKRNNKISRKWEHSRRSIRDHHSDGLHSQVRAKMDPCDYVLISYSAWWQRMEHVERRFEKEVAKEMKE